VSTLYKDKLIEITDREIVLQRYYFPSGKECRVELDDIERIRVEPASLRTGSWRLWGSGDLTTWFPSDNSRPRRDRIFFLKLKQPPASWPVRLVGLTTGISYPAIGFTAEDSSKVIAVLQQKGLLPATPAA